MQTLGRTLVRKTTNRIVGQLHLDRNADYRATIFLAGSGRSGTTWIADIINYRNEYRHISEPFHRKNVPMARDFGYRQYIRPDDRDPRYLDPAGRILSGRIRNLWTDKYNRKLVAGRRFVKEVRANLFLKWLRVNFPEMPIVLLLRHPCAVAASRMKLDWEGGADLRGFLAQPALMEDHLEPFHSEMAAARDPFERMILFWCAENYVPLRQLSPGDAHVACYEHFVLRPEAEVRDLFAYIGKPFEPEALNGVGKPSMATRKDSAILAGGSVLDGWRRTISDEQVARAVEILGRFGLDRLYGPGPEPLMDRPVDALSP
jgi:hypothetical protein